MKRSRPPRDPAEDEELAEALKALAYPVRLAMLRDLQTPRILKEIKVQPHEAPGEGAPDRPISRQGVNHHLEDLLAINAVQVQESEREFGTSTEYVTNHRTLFAISEQLRTYARLRPQSEPTQETLEAEDEPTAPSIEGPGLVLVKGLEEGKLFELDPGSAEEWTIGRRRDNEIALDFDPFVSAENARVRWTGEAHVVEDLEASRNGTRLNFQRIAPGKPYGLSTGDVVGVGRCLLVYQS